MTFALTFLTFVHVVISLAGITAGLVVVYGLLMSRRLDVWTAAFFATTVLTSVTGFLFPFHGFTPAQALGVLSLLLLALAMVARYRQQMRGPWRTVYVISALTSLYFNIFVLVVQLFQKVPALAAQAPTESEQPFVLAQAVALACFVATTAACLIRFRVSKAG